MTPLLAQRPRSDRAFERMYRRHVGDVYRYALAVMRNPADAEDVTQTTFLNAYRSYVEKGNRPEKPQNWLIAIAHNVCRQRFRQSARRPSEVAWDDDIADRFVEDEPGPGGEDIRRALGHLAALRSIGAGPLPASLASLFGGTGSGVGIAVAAKATAVVAAAAFAGSA